MPENAQPRSYGGGWVCDLGYRVEGAECLPLDIPEHAYPTGRSYGTGWECNRGYEEVDGTSAIPSRCPPMPSSGLPVTIGNANAGSGRRTRHACHCSARACLPDGRCLGRGWTCDRGYEAVAETCSPIAVPENAYLTNADYGAAWACERGFVRIDDRCDAVVVPSNAHLDEASYGPGWSCERGYEALNGACVAIDLPENAYLDRSGNRWSCNRGFQLSDGACVLGR